MSEGHVYVCKWAKLPDGTIRADIAKPKLRAEGKTIDEISKELSAAICLTTGDGEAVFEFEPPLAPVGKAKWFADGIVTLGPNSHFRFKGISSLTERGFCTRCKRPVGNRTNQTLAVQSMWPGDAVFSWDPAAEGLRVLLFSERLLAILSDEDRQSFDLRPVEVPARKRKKFFEVVPREFVPKVAIASLKIGGWRCDECGRVQFSHGRELGWGVHVISRSDLPKTSIFFVGTSTWYSLAMRRDRWKQMKDMLRRFDIKSELLAVAEQEEVATEFALPEINAVRSEK